MDGDWGIGLSFVLDVQGVNYNYNEYSIYHKSHPQQPMIGSETASCTCARNIYFTNNSACHLSVFSADSCAEGWWDAVEQSGWIAGGFAWTGFDYKGEPTPYSWPDVNSNFGIIDLAGFEKDTFYYYESWWTQNIVLHLFPHWNWAGMEGEYINVWIYTNVPQAELFLNGSSQGRQTVPADGKVQWMVPYAAGRLIGRGYDNQGRLLATATIHTTGEPAAIQLQVEYGNQGIAADAQDVALIRVEIVDDQVSPRLDTNTKSNASVQGLLVRTADNYISFDITGPGIILGVGNGDPSCLEPDKGTGRSAFGGLARVIVQSTTTAGTITLSAASPGLQTAKINIQTS